MIEDFIGIYPEFFSKQECDFTINRIETLLELGFGTNRQQENDKGAARHLKDDTFIHAQGLLDVGVEVPASSRILNERFWKEVYPDYSSKYSILNDAAAHGIYHHKLQKSNIGQGYHVWHHENANRSTAGRLLAFILYLNDIEEGGETEFLYYPKRIKPEAGTFILFPAAFTHTHRGNPPLTSTKYIMTGWVEY